MCMCLSVEHILREMEGGLISSERSQMRHRGLWAGSTMAPFPVKTYQWVGVIMRTLWTEKHLFIKGTSFSTPQKAVLFIIGDWNAKVGSQEITWSNRQMWPWSTKWLRAKANRVLPRERTGHSKHPLSTTREKSLHTDVTRWSTLKSDWLYSLKPKMEMLYTVSKNKTGSWLWLR